MQAKSIQSVNLSLVKKKKKKKRPLLITTAKSRPFVTYAVGGGQAEFIQLRITAT